MNAKGDDEYEDSLHVPDVAALATALACSMELFFEVARAADSAGQSESFRGLAGK